MLVTTCINSEDHLLAYMADARHVDDTLFFVAEEDFRLYRADTSEFAHLTKPHVRMVEQALWQEAQLSAGAGAVATGGAVGSSAPVAVDGLSPRRATWERPRGTQSADCTPELRSQSRAR